jgi:hypothetical protein
MLQIASRLPQLRQAATQRGDSELAGDLASKELDVAADVHDISYLYNNFTNAHEVCSACVRVGGGRLRAAAERTRRSPFT